jgi:hypothetical protein
MSFGSIRESPPEVLPPGEWASVRMRIKRMPVRLLGRLLVILCVTAIGASPAAGTASALQGPAVELAAATAARALSVSGATPVLTPPGVQTTEWDGKDDRGTLVSSGVYYYELRAAGTSSRRRMVLLR